VRGETGPDSGVRTQRRTLERRTLGPNTHTVLCRFPSRESHGGILSRKHCHELDSCVAELDLVPHSERLKLVRVRANFTDSAFCAPAALLEGVLCPQVRVSGAVHEEMFL